MDHPIVLFGFNALEIPHS